MRPDPLDSFREELVESFRQILSDPCLAPSFADMVVTKIRYGLAGQSIPHIRSTLTLERDARVVELLRQGLPPRTIAARMEIAPSTVYRAIERERERRRARNPHTSGPCAA